MSGLLAELIATSSGKMKKCLVLDLDNTLWGGVAGEDGPDRLIMDGPWRELGMLMAEKHKQEEHISFFIKLSGETLTDPKLPEWIELQLKRFNLKGEHIIFEIPESVAANKPHETQAFSKSMKAINCRVAIEHFGYAKNPEIIKYLSVDFLKIDGSLINNLATSKDNQKKVRAIVDLARASNTLCIAEHVDDPHCLVMLWQYSIDYIQGNLVQEPDKELAHDFEDEAALAGIIESQ